MPYLLIILLNLLFYFKTLRFGYVSDDLDIKDNPKHKNKIKLFLHQILGDTYFNSEIEHLYGIISHTLVCCLIYRVFGSNEISFFTALLFSIHPVNLEGSVWLSGRQYAMVSAFILLMSLFMPLGILFYFGTLIFRSISGIFAPLLFIRTQYWWTIFLIPIFYWAKMHDIQPFWNDFKKSRQIRPVMCDFSIQRMIFGIKCFAYYFLLCLFPRRLGMYHSFHYAFGLTDEDTKGGAKIDKWFWFGVLLIYTIATNVLFNWGSLTVFGLFWFALFIFQWCNFLPMFNQPIAQRYTYLANIGLQLALVSMIFNVPDLVLRYCLLTAFFVYYVQRCWLHLGAYKDDRHYLEYNLYDINFPDHYFAWTIRAERECNKDGRIYQALASLAEGLRFRPYDIRIHFHLAKILSAIGKFNEAATHYNFGVSYCKNDYKGHLIGSSITNDEVKQLGEIIKKGLNSADNNSK